MNFSQALDAAKEGKRIAREGFRDTCYIMAKYPDEGSQNTLPYLQMHKKVVDSTPTCIGRYIFPIDLSCESIFAEDWKIVE